MAAIDTKGPRVPAQNDLYTTLLVVAAGLLFAGIIFVITRSVQLFDWPFATGG